MPPAFLAVLSDPGSLVPLDEFHDWYDNEHIPLRTNHLPSFLGGARFSAADGQKPSWLALYEIDDTSTFQHESYTRLRANRSQREGELVKKLEVLDRRCCEVVWDSGVSGETTSLGVDNPTKVIVTHGFEAANVDEGVRQVEELVERLRGEEGWVRTRLFKCLDVLKVGVSVPPGPEAQKVPPFFVLHELLNGAVAETVVQGQPELRRWELYRAYPVLRGVRRRLASYFLHVQSWRSYFSW